MADKKICPLTYTTEKGAYDQETSDYGCHCVEEKCAWWNHYLRECAILSISRVANLKVAKKVKDDNEHTR